MDRLLAIAAAAGAEAAVKLHISRGDDLEWRDKRRFTPLMIAASRNRAGVCRLLLAAGVDAAATDALGRDALAIARHANSHAAAEAIADWLADHAHSTAGHQAIAAPELDPLHPEQAALIQAEPTQLHVQGDELATYGGGSEADLAPSGPPLTESPSSSELWAPKVAIPTEMRAQATEDEARPALIPDMPAPEFIAAEIEPFEILFGEWEAELEREAPPDNPALAAADAARQRRINEHEPIDDSADWTDFDAELPEFAKPLPRADDAEFQAALRRVLLLAAREGSVPRLAIEDLLSERGDALARDEQAEAQVLTVIGDLGAEIDERQELRVGNESYELFVEPAESPTEEREVDGALAFFEDLRSARNDPLRIYMRAVANKALLSAEREGELAKSMEAAVERALDALSRWDTGLRRLLDLVTGAASSPALLWPVIAVARGEADLGSESVESSDDEVEARETPLSEPDGDAVQDSPAAIFAGEPVNPLTDALAALRRIAEVADEPGSEPERSSLIREQLGALVFRRPFIARLGDHAPEDRSPEALDYRRAAADLLASRDEMARANLRLVYATAKRYLYSGVPLDDLMQEGNIGLLKAVDRFDWRRGFKFSTMATWWIKQQIGRCIPDAAFAIRPPVHAYEKASKLRQAVEAFERRNARPPTSLERAAMLGISIPKMEALSRPSSEPLSMDEASALGAFDHAESLDPFDVVAEIETAQLVSAKLAELKRKPEAIVRMRSGVGVHEAMTLEQIGSALGVTRERARQIESKAMRALSSAHSREKLAIATGRPLPKIPQQERAEAQPAFDLDSEDELDQAVIKDSADQNYVQPAAGSSESAVSETMSLDGLVAPAPLPLAVLRILDSARALGLDIEVGSDQGHARIHISDVPGMDRESRKLIREMFRMGFTREPGKGFKR